MRRGTLTFQATDMSDLFYMAPVVEVGEDPSDESFLNIEDTQFDNDKAWVTGKVPTFKPVNIGGDNVSIQAWFKGESFERPFVIRVYLEVEMVEELEEVTEETLEYKEEPETQVTVDIFL